MITFYQLKTNANARLANMGTSNALSAACVEMNQLRVPYEGVNGVMAFTAIG